jgi:pimeloyl-ACP methyl ester carboxylesterase
MLSRTIAAAAGAAVLSLLAAAIPVMAAADLGPPVPPAGFTPSHGELALTPCDPRITGSSGARSDVHWFCGLLPVDDVGSGRELSVLVASSHPELPFPGNDVLVYHPGGPGVFVGQTVLAMGPPVPVSEWSVLTWDGATSANGLGSCGGATAAFGQDRSPTTLPGQADAVAEECLTTGADSGRGAETAAWELEQIRDALGIERMDLLAHSYGTAIGEAYLAAYPGNVRRAVLDAPIALEVPWADRLAALGPVQAELVVAVLASCTPDTCGPELMGLAPSGYAAVREGVLARSPTVGSGDASLSATQIDQATLAALRSEVYWVDYLGAVREALAGRGSDLWTLSFRYFEDVDRNRYYQTLCSDLDHPTDGVIDYVVSADDPLPSYASELSPCARAPRLAGGLVDDGAAEVLLVASSQDPVAPASLLLAAPALRGSGSLCLTDVPGHTSYRSPGISEIIDSFLRDGDAAAAAAACEELLTG